MYRWIISSIIVFVALFWVAPQASATSSTVMISTVQTGDTLSASNEVIEIHNASTSPVDITDWCLYYMNATVTHTAKIACFYATELGNRLLLPSHSFALAISTQFVQQYPDAIADVYFSATLSQLAGHIKIVDATGNEVDRVGWGITAVGPEAVPADPAGAGYMLVRKSVEEVMVDTDDNARDFEVLPVNGVYRYGQIEVLVDLCHNIDGVQTELPNMFVLDENGNCHEPVIDVCLNIQGEQLTVPEGFYATSDSYCAHDLLSLTLTELHPNPTGGDAGHEFIEILNPHDTAIDLHNYLLLIGIDGQNSVGFEEGEMIDPHSYRVIYNDSFNFTLVNTSSMVRIVSYDGRVIDDSGLYSNPKEGESWARIGDVWQMTNQPTPGSDNKAFMRPIVDVVTKQTVPTPCQSNQYRHPETNRCRLITNTASTLAPCSEGQERNPETNRCRSTTAASSTLSPCKEGQERNPETNRCRSVVVDSIPDADYGVMGAQTTQSNNILLWSVAGVAMVGVGYAVWEWRRELAKWWRKVAVFVRIKK